MFNEHGRSISSKEEGSPLDGIEILCGKNPGRMGTPSEVRITR
jgi:hypothetical protein